MKVMLAAALTLSAPASQGFAEGLRKVVAVSRFENKTAYSGEIGIGMADQLAEALVKSGQFLVVERQTMVDTVAEQDWAASGRMEPSQSARTGKMTSAQIHIKGIITEYESRSSGGDSRIAVGGIRVGGRREDAHVGLLLQLIDTTTGEMLRMRRPAKKGGCNGWF